MQIIAHRGASAIAPENTMAAFEAAILLGADGIELDVHQTKDGVLVVMHDETVDRTTQGRGRIIDMTYDEIAILDAGYRHSSAYIGEKVPKLSDVLEHLQTTNLLLNIELKTDQIHYEGIEASALTLVKAIGMFEKTIFSSFYHPSLKVLQGMDATVQIAMLCPLHRPVHAKEAKAFGAQAIHPDARLMLNRSYSEEAKREGIHLRPYTVDEPHHIQALYALHVDAVITNKPDIARQAISS
nr:glycerophosphodiester phosphodiesterase [Bacilli bacterium]